MGRKEQTKDKALHQQGVHERGNKIQRDELVTVAKKQKAIKKKQKLRGAAVDACTGKPRGNPENENCLKRYSTRSPESTHGVELCRVEHRTHARTHARSACKTGELRTRPGEGLVSVSRPCYCLSFTRCCHQGRLSEGPEGISNVLFLTTSCDSTFTSKLKVKRSYSTRIKFFNIQMSNL